MSKLIGIDTETSHWDKKSPIFAVTEVGFVIGEDMFSGIMNPGEDILTAMQPDVIGLTGLTPDIIRAQDDSGEALLALTALLSEEDMVVIAHNWNFDRHALNVECKRRGIRFDFDKLRFIDTYRVAREIYDEGTWTPGGTNLPNFKLATCYYGIVGKPIEGSSHRASFDAMMSLKIAEAVIAMGIDEDTLISLSTTHFVPRVCPMGKTEKGKKWDQVNDGFLQWMSKNKVWEDDVGLEFAVLEEMTRRGMLS